MVTTTTTDEAPVARVRGHVDVREPHEYRAGHRVRTRSA
jgi:hypothetical protein